MLDEEFVLRVERLYLPFSCSHDLAKMVFSSIHDFFAGIFKPGINFVRVSLVKTQLCTS